MRKRAVAAKGAVVDVDIDEPKESEAEVAKKPAEFVREKRTIEVECTIIDGVMLTLKQAEEFDAITERIARFDHKLSEEDARKIALMEWREKYHIVEDEWRKR